MHPLQLNITICIMAWTKVCGSIVNTSNSTNKFGHRIGSWIITSSKQLQSVKIVISSLRIIIESYKNIRYLRNIFFCWKQSHNVHEISSIKTQMVSIFHAHSPISSQHFSIWCTFFAPWGWIEPHLWHAHALQGTVSFFLL